jgi:hypothetical protein
MNDDIANRLRDLGDEFCFEEPVRLVNDAANWIELYRDVIWHLWAHRHGCGRQDCALCTEAYRAFTEENERMLKDE